MLDIKLNIQRFANHNININIVWEDDDNSKNTRPSSYTNVSGSITGSAGNLNYALYDGCNLADKNVTNSMTHYDEWKATTNWNTKVVPSGSSWVDSTIVISINANPIVGYTHTVTYDGATSTDYYYTITYHLDELDSLYEAEIEGKKVCGYKFGDKEVTLHKWRAPELGDILNGKTMRLVYPETNMAFYYIRTFTQVHTKGTISTTGGKISESGSYDYPDGTNLQFTYDIGLSTLTVSSAQLYKSTCIPGNTISDDKVTELTRMITYELPDDMGISLGGSNILENQEIAIQVDDKEIIKKEYELQPLLGTDKIEDIYLVYDGPDDLDTTLFSSQDTFDPTDSKYTLLGDRDTQDVYVPVITIVKNSNTYDSDGNPQKPYNFSIVGFSNNEMGYEDYIVLFKKQFGSSTVDIKNAAGKFTETGTLSSLGLNTSSVLYPYVKKIVWK